MPFDALTPSTNGTEPKEHHSQGSDTEPREASGLHDPGPDSGSGPAQVRKRAPLSQRLAGLPRGDPLCARANREERLDNFEQAETLFREEICGRHTYGTSAIRELAMLVNRLEPYPDTITVLAQHRG